ncbi:MAG: helix-hairpin-helix domain-containing protein [Acidobacteriales bacterium]|nr:helix-hairpin-helix domain-containing protein [Terriglobales bacterium]
MPNNDPGVPNATTPPGADDLTRIRGISPKTANRLYEAGILTFAKLGAMSPEEIVARIGAVSGVSAESIAKRDWIGQARELASQFEPAAETTTAADGQHRADFAVKLQLNADNTVSQTHVMHMQSGGEEIWDGWMDERLISFFVQRATLSLAGPDAQAAAVVEAAPPVFPPEGPPAAPAAAPAEAAIKAATKAPAKAETRTALEWKGLARLQDLETIPAHGFQPSRDLRSGQPFDVRLLLDLSEIKSPQDAPLNYTATIYARGLDAQRNQTVGELRGTAKPTEKVTLKFEGVELPQGVYRLQATVKLTQTTKLNGSAASLQYLDGGLLQVR